LGDRLPSLTAGTLNGLSMPGTTAGAKPALKVLFGDADSAL
jgi:hypothetical protein